jgi:hypothetical protein
MSPTSNLYACNLGLMLFDLFYFFRKSRMINLINNLRTHISPINAKRRTVTNSGYPMLMYKRIMRLR